MMAPHEPNDRRSRGQERSRQRGQWTVADALLRLLAVGRDAYRATSLRTGMDYVARRVVLPHLRESITSLTPIIAVREADDQRWNVAIVPVLGALSGRLAAVLCCYTEVGENMPPPPVVGSWEWALTPEGPRTYWSREQFAVFGVPYREPGWWAGPQWLDELVAVADRPAVRAVLATMRADTTPVSRLIDFTVTPPSGDRYTIRGTGTRFDDDGQEVLRGMAMRLPLPDDVATPDPGHLEAVLGLSRDGMCAIDPEAEVMYLTAGDYQRLGLALPDSRHLPVMCHAADLDELRSYLRHATADLGRRQAPIHIRLAAAGGGWRRVELSATAVRLTDLSTHVWCRVSDVGG